MLSQSRVGRKSSLLAWSGLDWWKKKKGDIVCLLPYKVVLRKYQP